MSGRPQLPGRRLRAVLALCLVSTVAVGVAGVAPPASAATDLAAGKAVTSDSEQIGHPAAHANDANPATRWCAADGLPGHWLQVDLGTVAELTGTQVVFEFAREYRYQIAVSKDGAAFTTVVDRSVLGAAGGNQDTITASARYVRVTVTGLAARTWASITTLAVFGATGPVDPGTGVRVQQWQPYDLTLTSTVSYANPYRDASVSATFQGPGNTRLAIPGFFAGDGTWKVRFSPPATGAWTYTTTSGDPQLNGRTGNITAVANRNANVHGGILVDPANRHHYRYQDGTPYLQFQYEVDWLALMDFGDPNIPKAKRLIDMVSANGFNEILLNTYAHDTSWEPGDTGGYDFGPAAQYAWAGTNANPDHGRMNESFWQNFDRVMEYLYQKGVTAHLFLKVYNKAVTWPGKRSVDEDMYLKFVTARYQAYPNVLWDFSKEVFKETDVAYIADRLALIGRTDAYDRIRTIHDPDAGRVNGGFMNNPAIAANVDVLTDQHANAADSIYSDALGKRKAFNMPITNSEYNYQIGNDGGHTYSHVASELQVLKETIEVLMAGAYPGYYYTYHSWDVVRFDEVPAGIGQYKNLANYLRTRTRWADLSPDDALIGGGTPMARHMLAKPGSEYLGYLGAGGALTFRVAGVAPGAVLKAEWYNVRTGATQTAGTIGNGPATFSSPWSGPALLHLNVG